jgi:hypothetical protein
VTCCLSLSFSLLPCFVLVPVLTSETSRSTLFTGLSLERASSKENATCTHTHTPLLPNQTRKTNKKKIIITKHNSPSPTYITALLHPPTFNMPLTISFSRHSNLARFEIILFCTPIRSFILFFE